MQEPSADTTCVAPEAAWSATLSCPIFTEVAGSSTEKVPPKPQHSSGRLTSAISTPRTLRSSASGLEYGSSRSSLMLEERRNRRDEQLSW